MALGNTLFPGALDTATELPTPISTTQEDAVGFEHDLVHEGSSEAVLAVEAKVGADDSAVTTSIDFMLRRLPKVSKTSGYTVLRADKGKWIVCSGTTAFTLAMTAGATLAADWFCVIENRMTGSSFANKLNTIDPNGAETIDGLSTCVTLPGDIRIVQWDGTEFTSILLQGGYAEIAYSDSPATFTKPSGNFRTILAELWGGGGGGGGSPKVSLWLEPAMLSTTTTITVGAGGPGGTAQTADSTNGNAGTDGGNTTFGSIATSYGGGAGRGGTTGSYAGGGGGGCLGAGSNGGSGGSPNLFGAAGGADGSAGNTGMTSGDGGASGGGVSTAQLAKDGGGSLWGGSGGGSGGGITTGNIETAGGTGGSSIAVSGGGGTGGSAGNNTGTAGTVGPSAIGPGTGGGGAGGYGSGVAPTGGAGGIACGGGGGGASLNGSNSGIGGAGGNGLARVRYFP